MPVALSRAAHNPFSVVLGLPRLGLKTGAGDDLCNTTKSMMARPVAAFNTQGGANLDGKIGRMVLTSARAQVASNNSNIIWCHGSLCGVVAYAVRNSGQSVA